MLSILCFLFSLLLNFFISKKSLLVENSLYKKEIEILKRQKKNHLKFNHSDRIVFSILNNTVHLKDTISIVQPETILRWQRQLIIRFWTFKHPKRGGRPPVDNDVKKLILDMKNENLYWGYKKIHGELLKIGISLDTKTIRNIIAVYRRIVKINKSLTWRKFLTLQAKSIYAMDFFTIDTVLNQRYYVYFIIHHQSRQIVHFAMTQTPCVQFIKQQLIQFETTLENMVYMIHDNASVMIS
jgi:putative transposase